MYIMSNRLARGLIVKQRKDDPVQINDIISIDIENGKITIKADPELAQDLIYILSSLLDLSHTLQAKIIQARAQEAPTNEEDMHKRLHDFQTKSSQVFRRFQEHMNNGCNGNKSIALQGIKKDFNLGYGEAKVYVTEGRRLFKAESATEKKAQTYDSHTSSVSDSRLIPPKKKKPV